MALSKGQYCGRRQLLSGALKACNGLFLKAPQSSDANGHTAARRQKFVLDSSISYLDTNDETKPPVIFLHGNFAYSYQWRNVIPHVAAVGRCLVPDQIGMGFSGKVPNHSYRLVDHYKYLSAWIEEMALPERIHFVVQDCGAALAFQWCVMNKDRVASLTYSDVLVRPLPSLSVLPEDLGNLLKAIRSPAGEAMVLQNSQFLPTVLQNVSHRKLTEEEVKQYTLPYPTEKSKQPMLSWPRELPVSDEGPEDVVQLTLDHQEWLSASADLPKLYIHTDSGLFSAFTLDTVKDWPNNRMVTVKGKLFPQEDSAEEIGQAVKEFLTDQNN